MPGLNFSRRADFWCTHAQKRRFYLICLKSKSGFLKHEQKTKVHRYHGTAWFGENHFGEEAWRTPVDAGYKPR